MDPPLRPVLQSSSNVQQSSSQPLVLHSTRSDNWLQDVCILQEKQIRSIATFQKYQQQQLEILRQINIQQERVTPSLSTAQVSNTPPRKRQKVASHQEWPGFTDDHDENRCLLGYESSPDRASCRAFDRDSEQQFQRLLETHAWFDGIRENETLAKKNNAEPVLNDEETSAAKALSAMNNGEMGARDDGSDKRRVDTIMTENQTPRQLEAPIPGLPGNLETIIRSLVRRDLESVLLKLLKQHPTCVFDGKTLRHFVKETYSGESATGRDTVGLAPLTPPEGLPGCSSLGRFDGLPLEVVAHILGYLEIPDIFTFLIKVCRSLLLLFDDPQIWGNVAIEADSPRNTTVESFTALVHKLPEKSIRMLTLIMTGNNEECLDLLVRRKHWKIRSLHIKGKKMTPAAASMILRRLWSDSFAVLSFTDMNSKMDADTIVETLIFRFCPNVQKLRLEGLVKSSTLQLLSGIRRSSRSPVVGDNIITHLSFVGKEKNPGMSWEDVRMFGDWFPELEELYVATIAAEDSSWATQGALRQSHDLESLQKIISGLGWARFPRLKYVGISSLGEPTQKNLVRKWEHVHSSHLMGLLVAAQSSLQRIEISRGEEAAIKATNKTPRKHEPLPFVSILPVSFPRLQHISLGYFAIPRSAFLSNEACITSVRGRSASMTVEKEPGTKTKKQHGKSPAKNNDARMKRMLSPDSPQHSNKLRDGPLLDMKAIREVVFWHMELDGIGYPKPQSSEWNQALRMTYGDRVVGWSELSLSPGQLSRMTKGAGNW